MICSTSRLAGGMAQHVSRRIVTPQRALVLQRALTSVANPGQMDAAIAEINAEMADLFGEPMGASSSTPMREPLDHAPAPRSSPTTSRIPPVQGDDTAVAVTTLRRHISICAKELSRLGLGSGAEDLVRGQKLAGSIAECARAIEALSAV